MKKPSDWENVTAYGSYEALELGGHICKIMQVEETKSKNGKDMITISLDIAEGKQAGYYAREYKTNDRENKKWGCVVYQLLEDNDGNTNKGFKTFIDAVKRSNPKFDETILWSDEFCTYLKNKLVGGVFGREQYLNRYGEKKFSTKCMQFRDVEAIRKGVEVPEDKLLRTVEQNNWLNDFASVGNDDDLPF